MSELPKDLAGWQCLDEHALTRLWDIAVRDGEILGYVASTDLHVSVGEYRACYGASVYRKLAVAKQGDLDHKNFNQPMESLPTNPAERKPALPTDASARKKIPLATGLIDYFPLALCAVAELSAVGNKQHGTGDVLRWDRSKSGDESDALMRHFLERGRLDTDGVRHSAKVCWRAMALLEKEIEAEREAAET